ncbi:MAG: ATP-dependent endonuclease [Tissierellia bacterium]|nr:ATP-dependent endonuclease [Tissierellia bacterium]
MIIKSATIKNYRLLHDSHIDLMNDTTVIVGKNNSGKTAFTTLFETFLSKSPSFAFDDLSISSHDQFTKALKKYWEYEAETNDVKKDQLSKDIELIIPKISLQLIIEYNDTDNWTNLRPFITSLNATNQIQIIYTYGPKQSVEFLKNVKESLKCENLSDIQVKEVISTVKKLWNSYYSVKIQASSFKEETEYPIITPVKKDLDNLLDLKSIQAQRPLSDGHIHSPKEYLSKYFQRHYMKSESGNTFPRSKDVEALDKHLQEANKNQDNSLSEFFGNFTSSFTSFGYPGLYNEEITLKSEITEENIRNTVKIFYDNNGCFLPEGYNGLGYSNLIYIVSEILSFVDDSQESGTRIHLLFIEEPEAHMHPQMQMLFIKNITKFLKEKEINAQIIITTHSSHILANADFKQIKYFCREEREVEIRDLALFKIKEDEENKENKEETEKFLKQYLSLGKCDLFFADKAILIEGTVERLLMPCFYKKLDSTSTKNKLSEQYISVIEIGGAYMDKFKDLLEFLKLKTLIITDIDAIDPKDQRSKCAVSSKGELETSNAVLRKWLPQKAKISELLELNKGTDKNELMNQNKNIRVTYQTCIKSKCGRSFEEAFVIENFEYLHKNKKSLISISHHLKDYPNENDILHNSYKIQDYIDKNSKKTDLAFDLLTVDCETWKVPVYIKEGLEWLAQT